MHLLIYECTSFLSVYILLRVNAKFLTLKWLHFLRKKEKKFYSMRSRDFILFIHNDFTLECVTF